MGVAAVGLQLQQGFSIGTAAVGRGGRLTCTSKGVLFWIRHVPPTILRREKRKTRRSPYCGLHRGTWE